MIANQRSRRSVNFISNDVPIAIWDTRTLIMSKGP